MNQLKRCAAVSVAVAALVSTGLVRAADPPATTQQMMISYADLDLARPADVAVLYRRITLAAQRLCGPRPLTGSYHTSPGYDHCVTDAVAGAVARVHQPALTAFARSQQWIREASAGDGELGG